MLVSHLKLVQTSVLTFSKVKKEALLNHETAKQNNKTAISFYPFFSNTETHKETNSAGVGPVDNFVLPAKRVGSVSSHGCLDAQPGYNL